MIAGTLEIQMLANMARLAKDMSDAKSTVERSMQGIESAVASAKAALGALGISLGVGYFVSLIKGSIAAADHLGDLRTVTDLTLADLAGLKLLAAETGTDLDGLAMAVNRMSVAMGKDPNKFKALLGGDVKDNKEAFKQLADIFNSLTDIQQRNALAQAIFKKSWAEVAPALALGGKAIGEVMEKGAQLSGVTEDMTTRAHEFRVQMAELETTLGATRTKLVGEMLPGMNEVARAMREAAKDGGLLLTVWVGLGGALAQLLGMGEAAQTAKRLAAINEELATLGKQLESGSLNPKGANAGGFWSFLIPDKTLSTTAIANMRATVAALEAEKARLMPKDKPVIPAVDPALAAAAAAKAKAFLANKEKELYEARVAAIKGGSAILIDAIKTEETLATLAFKEGGINNQRTQEALLVQQAALAEKKLKQQLAEYQALKDLADKSGKPKDSAINAALIKKTAQEIADNDVITQARIRAARTETAQQQIDQYNAVNAAHEAQGAALADSMRDATVRENAEFDIRKANLALYLASAQGQIADDAQLRESLETQHQYNLFEIERNKHAAERSMQIGTWQLGVELLQSMAGKSKLAGIAAIAISKALAIAQVIQQTAVATMAAFAPPPIGLGPLGGAALAASIQTLGAIQIGLIAATGLIQASQVGGGGASIGSPSNPVITAGSGPAAASTSSTAPPPEQTVVYLNVTGVVTPEVVDEMITKLRDAIGNKDAIIIPQNSRQAADLGA